MTIVYMVNKRKRARRLYHDVYSADSVFEQSNSLLNANSLASSFELAITYVDLIELSNAR
jgi:hypothetical protein